MTLTELSTFWKDVTKSTKDVTLKITLDPKAEALLDEERDVNPLMYYFHPILNIEN